MKFLATQAGAFKTTAAVADAVLTYWLTLAQDDRCDVVEVPYLTEAGDPATASIALGRATGLAALDASPEAPSTLLDDASALVELWSRVRSARLPATGVEFEPAPSALLWGEL